MLNSIIAIIITGIVIVWMASRDCKGKKLDEIEWDKTNGNEFGIFTAVEVSEVPSMGVEV